MSIRRKLTIGLISLFSLTGGASLFFLSGFSRFEYYTRELIVLNDDYLQQDVTRLGSTSKLLSILNLIVQELFAVTEFVPTPTLIDKVSELKTQMRMTFEGREAGNQDRETQANETFHSDPSSGAEVHRQSQPGDNQLEKESEFAIVAEGLAAELERNSYIAFPSQVRYKRRG